MCALYIVYMYNEKHVLNNIFNLQYYVTNYNFGCQARPATRI